MDVKQSTKVESNLHLGEEQGLKKSLGTVNKLLLTIWHNSIIPFA